LFKTGLVNSPTGKNSSPQQATILNVKCLVNKGKSLHSNFNLQIGRPIYQRKNSDFVNIFERNNKNYC
jgi:hypothetical protein